MSAHFERAFDAISNCDLEIEFWTLGNADKSENNSRSTDGEEKEQGTLLTHDTRNWSTCLGLLLEARNSNTHLSGSLNGERIFAHTETVTTAVNCGPEHDLPAKLLIHILQFVVSRIQHIIHDLDGSGQRGAHRTLYDRSVRFGKDISLTRTVD